MVTKVVAVLAALVNAGSPPPWVPAEPGVTIGPPVTLTSDGWATDIVATADGYVAIWLERDLQKPKSQCLLAQRLSREGRPAGEERRVHCGSAPKSPALAAGPETIAVAWGYGAGVAGRILSLELEPGEEFYHSIGRFPGDVDLAWDGGGFQIIWTGWREAFAMRVGPSGETIDEARSIYKGVNAGETGDAAIACDDQRCAAYVVQGGGRSRTGLRGFVFVAGATAGGLRSPGGVYDVTLAAAADRLLTFVSTYGRVMGQEPLGGRELLFDYESNSHRMRHLSAATGVEGTLVAWGMEPRKAGGRHRIGVAFVHPSSDAARPYPMFVDHGVMPSVATGDGRTFVLLTGHKRFAEVQARLVEIDPQKFADPSAPRGPVVHGRIRTQAGQGAAAARIYYWLRLNAGGTSSGYATADADGNFELRHPAAQDCRPEADVDRILLWSQHDEQVSRLYESPSSPLAIRLRGIEPNAVGGVRLVVVDPGSGQRLKQNLSVILMPGVRGQVGVHPLVAGQELAVDGIMAGEHRLVIADRRAQEITHTLRVQSGMVTRVEVPFAMGSRPEVTVVAAPAVTRPEARADQVALRPGEDLVGYALVRPPRPPADDEPFRVEVPEGIGMMQPIRVHLRFEHKIFGPGGIAVSLILEGPGGQREQRDYQYHNMIKGTHPCDPVLGGGPDQCRRDRSFERPVSGPSMGFDPTSFMRPGTYRITADAHGWGEVSRTFTVGHPFLSRAFDLHQLKQMGDYHLTARAVIKREIFAGGPRVMMFRAVFSHRDRQLVVDVSDRIPKPADRARYLAADRWRDIPTAVVKNETIKLKESEAGFDATWPTGESVVHIWGPQLGEIERVLVAHYLSRYQSRLPR